MKPATVLFGVKSLRGPDCSKDESWVSSMHGTTRTGIHSFSSFKALGSS